MVSIKQLLPKKLPKLKNEAPLERNPSVVQNKVRTKGDSLVLIVILALALGVRLYQVNTPLADWHSWRQADTASVAVEYVKNGIDLLRPTYHDLSDIPSGKDNPAGYRMVEFPLISADVAFLYRLMPPETIPLHVFYRLYSILFSLLSIYVLYLIVQIFESKKTALIAAAIFALLPFNIFYSRAILPEVPLVFFSLAGLYSLLRFFNSPTKDHNLKNYWYWLSVVLFALALLLKPIAAIFLLPALYSGWQRRGWGLLKDKHTYLFVVLIFTPLLLWRQWITGFPEGIPAYEWLLNGNGIRFKGAWFRWLFADRLGRLILGYWGLLLLGFGFLHKSKNAFFGVWGLSTLVYLTVFATGNVQHDYYQIITIPIIAIYVAKGISFLLESTTKLNVSRTTVYGLLTTSILCMLAFSWYEVRGYYNINNPAIVSAGAFVDTNTETDALIIAPYGGDTAFLYQTNRRGWPIGGSIEKRIEQGADYYVTTTLDDEAKTLMEQYTVIESNSDFTLIKLTSPQSELVPDIQTGQKDNVLTNPSTSPNPSPSPSTSPTPSTTPNLPPGLQKRLDRN